MFQKLKNFLANPSTEDKFLIAASVIILFAGAVTWFHLGNDIGNSAVMITNTQMSSGGTGVILNSSDSESTIITNDHVCRLVKNGGVVVHRGNTYQVTSLLESTKSDLCLIKVADDLEVNTKVASYGPHFYDHVLVSGHPALMPNIITEGHVSGRSIIEVITQIRACTPEEVEDPMTGLICGLAGGLPTFKSFESVLVSATIMPGSSGSGVFNSSKELEGLVFAGSGGIGYGWTVPYEQLVNFLSKDAPHTEFTSVSNEVTLMDKLNGGSRRVKDINNRCQKIEKKTAAVEHVCNALQLHLIWEK